MRHVTGARRVAGSWDASLLFRKRKSVQHENFEERTDPRFCRDDQGRNACALLTLGGCAGFSTDGGYGFVQSETKERIDKEVKWIKSDADAGKGEMEMGGMFTVVKVREGLARTDARDDWRRPVHAGHGQAHEYANECPQT
ncbi:MAG: hypothetical protein M3150_03065 [Pseudomonadota bacterium]|nr:hypothetical protein [Pseudomonadota bacterium]